MDDLSLWEFVSSVKGWAKANGAEDKPAAPTPEEHDAMIEKFAHI